MAGDTIFLQETATAVVVNISCDALFAILPITLAEAVAMIPSRSASATDAPHNTGNCG